MHVSHLRDTKVGVGWRGNTHTLIKTNTLDACIVICAPPPPTLWHRPTHNTRCHGGGGGKRSNTSTAQTPLQCQAISPPPSFHVVVWVVGPLLVLPKVREGTHFLFAGVLVFFIAMWMSRSGDTVTPRGRCVTPSLLPAMYTCVTVCLWYGVA